MYIHLTNGVRNSIRLLNIKEVETSSDEISFVLPNREWVVLKTKNFVELKCYIYPFECKDDDVMRNPTKEKILEKLGV